MKRSRPTGCRNASRKADTPLSPPPAERRLSHVIRRVAVDDDRRQRDFHIVRRVGIDDDRRDGDRITIAGRYLVVRQSGLDLLGQLALEVSRAVQADSTLLGHPGLPGGHQQCVGVSERDAPGLSTRGAPTLSPADQEDRGKRLITPASAASGVSWPCRRGNRGKVAEAGRGPRPPHRRRLSRPLLLLPTHHLPIRSTATCEPIPDALLPAGYCKGPPPSSRARPGTQRAVIAAMVRGSPKLSRWIMVIPRLRPT